MEQRDRLKAIDIALDFMSSRVQELGRDLTVPRPVEAQVDITSETSGEPRSNQDLPEGGAEALELASGDREARGD
jgi:hypothetical protein